MSPEGRDTTTTHALGPRGTAAVQDLIGAEIAGWHVDDAIASGGFGAVYAVTHVTSGRRGALKVLHGHLIESEEMVARFLREAETVGRLRHPNVVELLDAGVAPDGRPFLVMELLDGVDLARAIAEQGRRAPAQALEILAPVCAALALAHEHGVIHRDLKASNVFVCRATGAEPPRVVLLDFGIAKLTGGLDLTRSRQVLGTPACMAPEQLRGDPVDARTDVYALGALGFHLLAGRMPFEDVSITMSQYLHLHAQRPSVAAAAPVPAELDAVIARAMAIDPAARYPGPVAFLAALRAAIVDGQAERREVDAAAVLVSARPATPGAALDDALLDALDAALPAAERALAERGFRLAVDLGDAALFVAAGATGAAACAAATAVYDLLAPTLPAPVIRLGVAVHAGPVELAGDEVTGGALVDLDRWPVAVDGDGVVASAACAGGAVTRLR